MDDLNGWIGDRLEEGVTVSYGVSCERMCGVFASVGLSVAHACIQGVLVIHWRCVPGKCEFVN